LGVAAVAIAFSILDLRDYAGIDLRNRVVGARALLLGLDPYRVEWRPGVSLELADYQQRYPGISRVTVAPPVLLAYAPFASLGHRTQQLLWWGLQWAALLAAILILFRSYDCAELRRAFLLVAVLCFVGSWFWRLHVERGQYYVFLALLLCLDVAALRNAALRTRWLGVPIGLAVALRPTNGVLVPLLWLMGERAAAVKAAVTAALVLAGSVAWVGPGPWQHLVENVRLAAFYEMDPEFEARHFGPVVNRAPAVIEGLDFSRELPYRGGGSTIQSLIKRPWAVPLSRMATVMVVLAGMAMMWWMARQAHLPRDALLLLLTMMPVLVELTGTLRNTYTDVAFLPVIAVLIPLIGRSAALVALSTVTLLLFLGPLESKWVSHFRHLLVVLLVLATLLDVVAIRSQPEHDARMPAGGRATGPPG
jgi:hypothetical protein